MRSFFASVQGVLMRLRDLLQGNTTPRVALKYALIIGTLVASAVGALAKPTNVQLRSADQIMQTISPAEMPKQANMALENVETIRKNIDRKLAVARKKHDIIMIDCLQRRAATLAAVTKIMNDSKATFDD